MDKLLALRRRLNSAAELSGEETETARIISGFFSSLELDETLEGLGGAGSAFVFDGALEGPTALLRCELDAVRSLSGPAHLCGHDGHMAILAGVGILLSRNRPSRGRAVLLYQPAEETGAGAAAVIEDPRFAGIAPDFAFALHNLPGFPLGSVVLRDGPFACASRGMIVRLSGRPAHAAEPERGVSPAAAMCEIIEGLGRLPEELPAGEHRTMVTVVGAKMGGSSFGVSPGDAEVRATLRSGSDGGMAALASAAERLASEKASPGGLGCTVEYADVFSATVNAPSAVDLVRKASRDAQVIEAEQPFPWSEDFGRFTSICPGALFGLGAGEGAPSLHSSRYEFPDALIERGVSIMSSILAGILS